MSDSPQQLLDLLQREMRDHKDFVRIHAAEALCEHGFGDQVGPELQGEIESTTPGYRVGIWRVMARIAANDEERASYQERIRRVMLDAAAPDRVGAAESLGKLGVGSRADRPALEEWLTRADDATAPFALWPLLHSSTPAEREADEARLARLLESSEPVARQRAAYVLGRLTHLFPNTIAQLEQRVAHEPADSPARVYLLGAVFRHAPRGSAPAVAAQGELLRWLEKGKVNEQFEAASALGQCGSAADRPSLTSLLESPDADARVGAAAALLRLPP